MRFIENKAFRFAGRPCLYGDIQRRKVDLGLDDPRIHEPMKMAAAEEKAAAAIL